MRPRGTCAAWHPLVRMSIVCSCILAACSSVHGKDRGDPKARVTLWGIPIAGNVPPPPPVQPRDAGRASPRDAGTKLPPSNPRVPDAASSSDDDAGPPDPRIELLDPDAVYFFGKWNSNCAYEAVAPVLAPSKAVAGFDCNVDVVSGHIRPTDGRLLYITATTTGDQIFAFHCDGCQHPQRGSMYTLNPQANDDVIPMPGCSMGPTPTHVLVSPEGQIIHGCDYRWFDDQGRQIYDRNIHAFGHAGRALTDSGVLDLVDLSITPFVGLPATFPTMSPLLTARVTADGYLTALGSADPNTAELWHIAASGAASLVGTYPPLPAGETIAQSYYVDAKLDASARLYQSALNYTGPSSRSTIVRRSVGGTSEVVYDEANMPLLELWERGLFTGP